MTQPNIEERLAAAAFQILTDGYRHGWDAKRWALRYLRRAANGRPTEFLRSMGVR
jgi:hypothetical protein